jgi:DNA (cytosine-5)-methyltransferase 1
VSEALLGASKLPLNNSEREHNETTIVRYSKMGFGEREQLGRVDRLDPAKPSKTIIAGGNKGGGRSHLHPYTPRTLTVRESARLQTFPDNYEFLGKNGRQFTLVGNAVPPLLGEVLARHIGALVFGLKFKNELVHRVQNIGVEQAKKKLRDESLKGKSVRPYEIM